MWVGPKGNHKCSYKRETEEDMTQRRRWCERRQKGEDITVLALKMEEGVVHPGRQETWLWRLERQVNDSPLEHSRECRGGGRAKLCWHLDTSQRSRFRASGLQDCVRINVHCCKSPCSLQQPQETNTTAETILPQWWCFQDLLGIQNLTGLLTSNRNSTGCPSGRQKVIPDGKSSNMMRNKEQGRRGTYEPDQQMLAG